MWGWGKSQTKDAHTLGPSSLASSASLAVRSRYRPPVLFRPRRGRAPLSSIIESTKPAAITGPTAATLDTIAQIDFYYPVPGTPLLQHGILELLANFLLICTLAKQI